MGSTSPDLRVNQDRKLTLHLDHQTQALQGVNALTYSSDHSVGAGQANCATATCVSSAAGSTQTGRTALSFWSRRLKPGSNRSGGNPLPHEESCSARASLPTCRALHGYGLGGAGLSRFLGDGE